MMIPRTLAAFLALAALPATVTAASSTSIYKAEVTGSTAVNARMRSGPGTNYGVSGSVMAGDTIYNIQESGRWYDGYQWLRVNYRGRTGYIWGAMVCTNYYLNGSQQCNNRQHSGNAGGNQGGNTHKPSYASTKRYRCGHQGMTMTVTYRDEGQDSVAYVSHNGAAEVRLVKPWGSNGDQYYLPNQHGAGIYGKGRNMTYAMYGYQQNCYEQ